MRLLTKTNLYFLVVMLVLLAAGGFYLLRQFNNELTRQTDLELVIDEVNWIRYLQSEADNGSTFILRTPYILIYPTDGPVEDFPSFTQTTGFSVRQQKVVPYRRLSHLVLIRGIPYQIIINRSQEQKLDFVANVTRILLFVFFAMFVIMLLFNGLINRTVWQPFRRSLDKIRRAELQKMEAIRFESSDIAEFNELNTALNFMTTRIYNDFVNMKEFTENAAHEMQTPLAVAQSKLELLMQDVNLTDEQVVSLAQAGTALKRLSNLNQALLLLAKIENKQYEVEGKLSLNTVATKYLQLFEEIIKDKQVTVEQKFSGEFEVAMHNLLADSLISNLIGNAVKYNYPGGSIAINISANSLTILNTSRVEAIPQQQVFKRFQRHNSPDETSNGLGLAIVKKICDSHKLNISYSFSNGLHSFNITRQVEA